MHLEGYSLQHQDHVVVDDLDVVDGEQCSFRLLRRAHGFGTLSVKRQSVKGEGVMSEGETPNCSNPPFTHSLFTPSRRFIPSSNRGRCSFPWRTSWRPRPPSGAAACCRLRSSPTRTSTLRRPTGGCAHGAPPRDHGTTP